MPLKEFHDGAFKLAVETGTAILPAIIFNTKKVLPPGKTFFFWPSKMELAFFATSMTVRKSDDLELLKQKLHRIMSEYYMSHLKINLSKNFFMIKRRIIQSFYFSFHRLLSLQ